MKKILTIFVMSLVIFSLGFAMAANDDAPRDGAGQMQDNVIETEDQDEYPMLIAYQNGEGAQNRFEAKEGNYKNSENQEVKIERNENKLQIRSGEHSATCSNECNLTQEKFENKTKFYAKLSNGKDSEIKIMPDVASERALERLRLKVCNESAGCMLELKEVGKDNESKFAYEMKRDRKAKFLGFIGAKMNVEAQVDSETGEVIKTKKPWWSFLASEPEEVLAE